MRHRSPLYPYRYYLVAMVVIMVDQIVKLLIRFNMELGESHAVIGDVLKINYVLNDGAAFGLTLPDLFGYIGIEMSPETGKRILTLFSIFAVVIIIYFLRLTMKHRSPLPFFVALILGGALGNIVDRVFYGVWFRGEINDPQCMGLMHGCVVDMFFVDLGTWHIFGREMMMFPVFNIADFAISTGIIAIFVFQRRFQKIAERHENEMNPVIPPQPVEEAPEETAPPEPPVPDEAN
jgi:signal peptidase II